MSQSPSPLHKRDTWNHHSNSFNNHISRWCSNPKPNNNNTLPLSLNSSQLDTWCHSNKSSSIINLNSSSNHLLNTLHRAHHNSNRTGDQPTSPQWDRSLNPNMPIKDQLSESRCPKTNTQRLSLSSLQEDQSIRSNTFLKLSASNFQEEVMDTSTPSVNLDKTKNNWPENLKGTRRWIREIRVFHVMEELQSSSNTSSQRWETIGREVEPIRSLSSSMNRNHNTIPKVPPNLTPSRTRSHKDKLLKLIKSSKRRSPSACSRLSLMEDKTFNFLEFSMDRSQRRSSMTSVPGSTWVRTLSKSSWIEFMSSSSSEAVTHSSDS